MKDTTNGCHLDTKQAAEYLTSLGFKTSPATLSKWRCISSNGPVFQHFGRKPLYTTENLLAWANAKTSAPRRSTSDVLNETDVRSGSL